MKQIIVLILFICVFASQGKQLPSFIKKCKRNDPGLDECMKNAILDFQERLNDGVKELRLPTLNPYVLPKATLQTSWMNTTLTNLKLYYSNYFNIDYIKVDLDKGEIYLNQTVPYLYMKSDYELDGKLLQIVLHGEGELELKENNTVIQIKIYGTKTVKDGKEYLNLTNIDYKIIDYTVTYMYMHDLFRNNPELTKRINEVVAENISELTKDVIPLAEKIVSSIDLALFKEIFDSYSLDELFD